MTESEDSFTDCLTFSKGNDMPGFDNKKFITELDGFFAREDLEGAGRYLREQYALCAAAGNDAGRLTVLNEEVGYYRQTGEREAALEAVDEALSLTEKLDIGGEISGATIILNCATTMKCFGKSEEALKYYASVQKVFENELGEDDPLLAGFYNNMALALQDTGRIAQSEDFFRRAIEITLRDSNNALETAVSYVNLAHLLFDKDMLDDEINRLLDGAVEILSDSRYFTFPKYAFTCRKCAPSFGYFGRFADEKYLTGRADAVYAGA